MGLFDDDETQGKAFTFERIGDSVTGVILDSRKVQSTDLNTGELRVWQDGRPRYDRVFTLQTDMVSNDDDGIRRVYLGYGDQKTLKATPAALKADIGWTLTVTYERDEPPKKRGHNPAKVKRFDFTPPAPTASAEANLSGILA